MGKSGRRPDGVAPVCSKCRQPARLTDGQEIYPHRPDLYAKPFYKCDGCQGYVGCHPGSRSALGTPADNELRNARQHVHKKLDPLWKNAPETGGYAPEDMAARFVIMRAARGRVYAWLAEQMGLSRRECHTGEFNIAQCRKAWTLLHKANYRDIRAWAKARKTKGAKNVKRSAA